MKKITLTPAETITDIVSKRIKISDIELDPDNPNSMNKEQLEQLEKSMKLNQDLMDVIVNTQTATSKKYKLVDGHQKITVLIKNGVKTVLAKIGSWTREQEILIQQSMNKTRGQHSQEKDAKLYKLIYDSGLALTMTEITPITMDEIKLTIDKFYDTGLASENADEVPELQETSNTKPGDTFQLGRHRLICGDNRDAAIVEKLFQGKKTQQLNTDPPYGVNYAEKNEFLNKMDAGNRIQEDFENEDGKQDYKKLYSEMLVNVPFDKDRNTIYIWSGSGNFDQVTAAMKENDCKLHISIVWVKNNHVMGRSDYMAKHELCAYGWKGKHEFFGGFQTSVFEEDKPMANSYHPTQKPVALIAKTILHGTKPDDLVYDPYGGSGTCLIACEENDRTCYMIELMGNYCDVIIKRWEKLTGKTAEKI